MSERRAHALRQAHIAARRLRIDARRRATRDAAADNETRLADGDGFPAPTFFRPRRRAVDDDVGAKAIDG